MNITQTTHKPPLSEPPTKEPDWAKMTSPQPRTPSEFFPKLHGTRQIRVYFSRAGNRVRSQIKRYCRHLKYNKNRSGLSLEFTSFPYESQVSRAPPVISNLDPHHGELLDISASLMTSDPWATTEYEAESVNQILSSNSRPRKNSHKSHLSRATLSSNKSRLSDATLVFPHDQETHESNNKRLSGATITSRSFGFYEVQLPRTDGHISFGDFAENWDNHHNADMALSLDVNASGNAQSGDKTKSIEEFITPQVYPTNMPKPRLFADNMTFVHYPSCIYRSASTGTNTSTPRSVSTSTRSKKFKPSVVRALKFDGERQKQDPMPTFLAWARDWLHKHEDETAATESKLGIEDGSSQPFLCCSS